MNIIFDLGGVLLQEADADLSIALPPGLDVEQIDGKPPKIFYRMFEFTDLIFNKPCMRDYFIGKITGYEIVQTIKNCIDKKEYDFFFKSAKERILIKYGSEFILLPEKEASLTVLKQDGLEFVKKCKQYQYRILILSNWDQDSFNLIKNKFPEIFSLCDPDDIIIPAKAGFIKPEPEIYEYVINKRGLDLTKTFFVDDNVKNVLAAQKCGIKSIVHANWQQTEKELISKGFHFLANINTQQSQLSNN